MIGNKKQTKKIKESNKIEKAPKGYKVDTSQPSTLPRSTFESISTRLSNLTGGSAKVDQYGKGYYSWDNPFSKPNPARFTLDKNYLKKKLKKK